jgi:hypothetical protein
MGKVAAGQRKIESVLTELWSVRSGLDSSGYENGPSEDGDESSGAIKYGYFVVCLRTY